MIAAPSRTGRWQGQVTKRPLPEVDTTIIDLPTETRENIANLWWSQAATEYRVASSFEVVRDALGRLQVDAGILQLAERAVDDEYRHNALCLQMAERYAGRPFEQPKVLEFAHPAHASAAAPRVRDALFVVGQCVYNETFASAYLQACLDGATHPLAKAALRELLSDEIDHARIGWAYLSTLAPEERAALEEWLLPLAVSNLREWRSINLPSATSELEAHGLPARERIQTALLDALSGIILPGLEHNRFHAKALKNWVVAGAVDIATT
jgi:hypothetical protein